MRKSRTRMAAIVRTMPRVPRLVFVRRRRGPGTGMRIVDVHDLPGAVAERPSHRFIAPCVDGTPVHGRRDGIVPGDERQIVRDPDAHVGEIGVRALERRDLGTKMMLPDVVEADVADAVLVEYDVG